MLTQEELKEKLSYHPETGLFMWKESTQGTRKGAVAGCLSHGYRVICIQGRKHFAHRLAWCWFFGAYPSGQIDHINGSRDDNSIGNLRDVPQSQNMFNKTVQKNSKTGIKNVVLHKPSGLYQVKMGKDGVRYSFGYFKDIKKAEAAAITARDKLHGEYAKS